MSTLIERSGAVLISARDQARWIVRREVYRQPRFGEHRRDVTRWAVRMYFGDRRANYIEGSPTYFESSRAAHDFARRECQRVHGRGAVL